MTAAGPAEKAAVREARQTARMRRWADHYPWAQCVWPGVYAIGIGALYRRPWQGLPLAVVLLTLELWMWRPGGSMRRRLAARYVGFRPSPVRPPRSREERVFLITVAVWLVVSVVMLGFLAAEWARLETACPTPDGYNYADARWGWSPPGPTCAEVPDLDGRLIPASSPSPGRWLLLVVPAVGLGVVVVTARRWWRVDRSRYVRAGIPQVGGETRVFSFYDERRRASTAVEFGFPWLEGTRTVWRLRWLSATGELVGFRLTWPRGSSPSTRAGGAVRPEVTAIALLLVEPDGLRVRRVLDGYEEQVRRPGGWEWVRARLRAASPV